jgi:hypothetical protein
MASSRGLPDHGGTRSAQVCSDRGSQFEAHLLTAPAANWREGAEKARYLLNLFAATLTSQDPRRQKLIAAVLADFARLSGEL